MLVQHAASDPAFIARCAELAGRMLARGEFSPVHYALLFDRARITAGQPQRYGTQLGADAAGRFIYTLEDPEQVNRWRRGLQLAPLSDATLRDLRRVDPDRVFGPGRAEP